MLVARLFVGALKKVGKTVCSDQGEGKEVS
jgi:hypothetical protein